MKLDEIDILARTIYGEARGEYARVDGGLGGLIAVGNVVMNRLKTQSRFGKTLGEVCQKPYQFSCWNEKDPNQRILKQNLMGDPMFQLCLEVARRLYAQEWPDLTKGSDHYHAKTMPALPPWAMGHTPRFCIGQHIFYSLKKG